jgi:hypothetical protein
MTLIGLYLFENVITIFCVHTCDTLMYYSSYMV